MIRKILGIGFVVLVVVTTIWWYFTFKYVPKGEEFDLQYTNLELLSSTGSPKEEKYEFRKYGFYTRTFFNVNGEELIYKFDIRNDGTLDAKLKYDPIFLRTDMYFKKHVKYTISYLDDTDVKAGDVIKEGEVKTFKVKIHYSTAEAVTQNSQFYESYVGLIFVRN